MRRGDLILLSFIALLREAQGWKGRRLDSLSDVWRPLPQRLRSIQPMPAPPSPPADMVLLPSASFLFQVTGLEIEGFNWEGTDVQYPWETSPRSHHVHEIQTSHVWMDKYPVTNEQYKRFVDGTHYRPSDDHNFLCDWKGGTYPPGWGKKPVTWVSLDDARTYAKWAGKRLPHEWEWQFAAQGTEGLIYPWGNNWNDAAVPAPNLTRSLSSPNDADSHPAGASPFGVIDWSEMSGSGPMNLRMITRERPFCVAEVTIGPRVQSGIYPRQSGIQSTPSICLWHLPKTGRARSAFDVPWYLPETYTVQLSFMLVSILTWGS